MGESHGGIHPIKGTSAELRFAGRNYTPAACTDSLNPRCLTISDVARLLHRTRVRSEAKQSKVLDPPVRDRAPETRIVSVSGIVDGRQVSFPLTVTVYPTFNFGGWSAARALGAMIFRLFGL
jgi:hypothetical protein